MPRKIVSTILVLTMLFWANSNASYCISPDLDRVFEDADYVFIAQLDSAKVVDDWTAEGEFRLQEGLKGYPPEKIPFKINFNTGCHVALTWSSVRRISYSPRRTNHLF